MGRALITGGAEIGSMGRNSWFADPVQAEAGMLRRKVGDLEGELTTAKANFTLLTDAAKRAGIDPEAMMAAERVRRVHEEELAASGDPDELHIPSDISSFYVDGVDMLAGSGETRTGTHDGAIGRTAVSGAATGAVEPVAMPYQFIG